MLALLFYLLLSLPVVLLAHELGHFFAARHFEAKVLRVAIGFGPKVFALTDRHNTEWTLSLLPFRASVEIYDVEQDGHELDSDSLSAKPLYQRAIIFGAGPVASFLLAAIIYVNVHLAWSEAVDVSMNGFALNVASLSLCVLSLLVGLVNLLPILPLDGGWLLICVVESATGRRVLQDNKDSFCTAGRAVLLISTVLGLVYSLVQIYNSTGLLGR